MEMKRKYKKTKKDKNMIFKFQLVISIDDKN